MRAKALLAALMLPALPALAPTAAEAALCESLRDQLSQVRDVTGNTAETRKYTNALAQQNLNIRKVQNDLRRFNCSSGSITVFGGANPQICRQLQDSLGEMEENRRYLSSQRDTLQRQVKSGSSERRRLQAALRDNGCEARVQEAAFTTPSPVEEPESKSFTRIPSPGGSSGALRTMCVRTCDGAFFPISSNASTGDFQRDAAICSNMCPQAETQLYYHSLKNSESADMVSATTGEPYRALPAAFAYRNRLPGEKPICGCSANNANFGIPAETEATTEEPATSTALRPSLSGETQKTSVETAAEASVPERPYDPDNSKVRVIGPQFLPTESGGLRAVGPNG